MKKKWMAAMLGFSMAAGALCLPSPAEAYYVDETSVVHLGQISRLFNECALIVVDDDGTPYTFHYLWRPDKNGEHVVHWQLEGESASHMLKPPYNHISRLALAGARTAMRTIAVAVADEYWQKIEAEAR